MVTYNQITKGIQRYKNTSVTLHLKLLFKCLENRNNSTFINKLGLSHEKYLIYAQTYVYQVIFI